MNWLFLSLCVFCHCLVSPSFLSRSSMSVYIYLSCSKSLSFVPFCYFTSVYHAVRRYFHSSVVLYLFILQYVAICRLSLPSTACLSSLYTLCWAFMSHPSIHLLLFASLDHLPLGTLVRSLDFSVHSALTLIIVFYSFLSADGETESWLVC